MIRNASVAIRCDASVEIGLGHVMRSLTLAEVLRDTGVTARFLSREGRGSGIDAISSRGFDVVALPEAPFRDGALAVPLADELARSMTALEGAEPYAALIVDHYALGESYEAAMRRHVSCVAVIDDLANRRHDCDLLLDQNLSALAPGRYDALLPAGCVRLLGPQYALLRAEFRTAARREFGPVRQVLISFGGFDEGDRSTEALAAVREALGPGVLITVVLAATAPHAARVAVACRRDPNARFVGGTERVAELMAAADIAVGAGGTGVWERASMALPSIVVSVADNQKEAAAACADAGMLVWLGDARTIGRQQLVDAVRGLALDARTRRRLGVQSASIVGVGARGAITVAQKFVEVMKCSSNRSASYAR